MPRGDTGTKLIISRYSGSDFEGLDQEEKGACCCGCVYTCQFIGGLGAQAAFAQVFLTDDIFLPMILDCCMAGLTPFGFKVDVE